MKWIVALIAIIVCGAAWGVDLAPVAPATDWLGVGIVSAIGIVAITVAAYIVHIKRTPGLQLGEEQLEKIIDGLHRRQGGVVLHVHEQPDPLAFDGLTFQDAETLEKYKAAKAIVDSHRKETP